MFKLQRENRGYTGSVQFCRIKSRHIDSPSQQYGHVASNESIVPNFATVESSRLLVSNQPLKVT